MKEVEITLNITVQEAKELYDIVSGYLRVFMALHSLEHPNKDIICNMCGKTWHDHTIFCQIGDQVRKNDRIYDIVSELLADVVIKGGQIDE